MADIVRRSRPINELCKICGVKAYDHPHPLCLLFSPSGVYEPVMSGSMMSVACVPPPEWCHVCEEEPATETSALGPVCFMCFQVMMALAANAGRDALAELKKEREN